MKQNKLLIVGMLVLPILLSACGGASGSSANSATTINGITVPPAPDATLNAATLAGVDSNSNGVRDDVERSIAVKATNQTSFSASLSIAKEYQNMVTNAISGTDVTAANKKIACITINNPDTGLSNIDIAKLVTDNPQRLQSYKDKAINAGGFALDPLNDCK